MIQLDYRDARPIYSQIVDGFRERIITGVLPAEERLPSVRELASALTINPNTIQRAYRELEAGGWIVTVPGKGCFVCGVPKDTAVTPVLEEFDKLTQRLCALGVTRQELIRRLQEGEDSLA